MFVTNAMKRVRLATLTVAATALFAAGGTHASFINTTADNAVYTLSWTNVASLYTFTYVADFTNYGGTDATDNDYAMAISIATTPGNVDWTAGSILAAPGTDSNWSIFQNVVTNSNGCPSPGAPSKDWCIGLNSSSNDGPLIDTSTILTWMFTMTLTSGTPNFEPEDDELWSNKFVTTDGIYDSEKGEWNFGHYQVSEPFQVSEPSEDDPGCEEDCGGGGQEIPVPGTLVLLGLGLLGLRFRRRLIAS